MPSYNQLLDLKNTMTGVTVNIPKKDPFIFKEIVIPKINDSSTVKSILILINK